MLINFDRQARPYSELYGHLKDRNLISATERKFGRRDSMMMARCALREGISGGPSDDYFVSMVINSQAPGPLAMDLGSGRFTRPNRVGDIIIAPPSAYVHCDGPGPFESLIVSFPGEEMNRQLKEFVGHDRVDFSFLHSRTHRDSQLEMLMRSLWVNLNSCSDSSSLVIDGLFMAFIGRLLGVAQHQVIRPPRRAVLGTQPMRKCLDYMREHLNERIGLDELSIVTGISLSHLAKLFKRTTGLTLHQQLMLFRVARAKDLIDMQKSSSLAQIAHDCGFTDQAHLTRCFHQVIGTTPAAYRRNR